MKVIISIILSLFIFNCQSFANEFNSSSSPEGKDTSSEKFIENILREGAILLVDVKDLYTSNSREDSYKGN